MESVLLQACLLPRRQKPGDAGGGGCQVEPVTARVAEETMACKKQF